MFHKVLPQTYADGYDLPVHLCIHKDPFLIVPNAYI